MAEGIVEAMARAFAAYGGPPDHLPIYFRAISAISMLLGAGSGVAGAWLLTFGIRGRDSFGSVIAGFGLLGGCVFFGWYGMSSAI